MEERCPIFLQEAHAIAGPYLHMPHVALFSARVLHSVPRNFQAFRFWSRISLPCAGRKCWSINLDTSPWNSTSRNSALIPLMTKLGVGIGLLGEHGAESIHSAFNNYDGDLKNIPLASRCLKTIADQHQLSCVTDISNSRPIGVSRKRKASQQ